MSVTYGSVCSGIEAASVAWHPLGWAPAWFAEIEPFPSAVLAHHWPQVPNLGDFTAIREKIAEGAVEAPDVLVGGTPCQAFSVAGLRQSLDDKRGQLTLEFVRLADALDSARSLRGKLPATIVWENVPGVLNTPDNAFGCFLAGLVGEDDPLVAPGGRWSNAGYVRGPARAAAWRVLDAQYFGVAQRRRRVFVVASAGGVSPEQVLFELDGVRRDSPPRREAGKGTTHDVAPCLTSGGRGVERTGKTRGQDPVVAVPILEVGKRTGTSTTDPRAGLGIAEDGELMYTLQAGAQHGVAVAFSSKDYGADASEGLAPTMRSMGHNENHANGGGQLAVAFGVAENPDLAHCLRSGASKADKHESTTYVAASVAFQDRADCLTSAYGTKWNGNASAYDGSLFALALHENQRHELTLNETSGTVKCAGGKPGQGYPAALVGMQVRRLTPTECELLQGFPDGHTLIPWRGKGAAECPDGPRYKVLGNSMAVPVMRWIGARIARQLEMSA